MRGRLNERRRRLKHGKVKSIERKRISIKANEWKMT